MTQVPLKPMDYEEIRQLQARYSFAVDFGDRAGFEACFAPGGSFSESGLPEGLPGDMRLEGRPELGTFVDAFFDAGQGHLRHWSSPPLIEGEGEGHEATGRSYLMVLRPGSAPHTGVILTGVYHDRYTKIDGRWYFASRAFSADPQHEHRENPSKDPLVERLDAFVAGRPAP
jgi:hypothetical protein